MAGPMIPPAQAIAGKTPLRPRKAPPFFRMASDSSLAAMPKKNAISPSLARKCSDTSMSTTGIVASTSWTVAWYESGSP